MRSFTNILLALLTIIVLMPLELSAQRRRTYTQPKQASLEALPRIAIDTVKSSIKNTSIVVYSNNTWEYLHHDVLRTKDIEAYNTHWDSTQIFSYKSIELSDLPSVIDLTLIDNINGFCSPTVGNVISKYGMRRRAHHNGTDIPMKMGEPLFASFDGKVRYAKFNSGGYGYLVIIRHPNGLESWYAHMVKLNCASGDYVKAGQIIGFAGNTGRSRGNHLHFELRYCDQSFDPEFLIDFQNGTLKYQTFALEKSFFNIRSRASEILEEDDDAYFANEVLYSQAIDSAAINKAATADSKPKVATISSQSNTGGTVYHTVRSGDMLGKISAKYGVSIDQLCRLNNITRTTTLRLNQRLRVK